MKKAFYFIPLLPIILGLAYTAYKILVFLVMVRPVVLDMGLEDSFFSYINGNNIYKEFIFISAISLAVFLILLTVTIINIFKKREILLIICMVLSISVATVSVEMTSSRLSELYTTRIAGVLNMALHERLEKLSKYIGECSCRECVMKLYDLKK